MGDQADGSEVAHTFVVIQISFSKANLYKVAPFLIARSNPLKYRTFPSFKKGRYLCFDIFLLDFELCSYCLFARKIPEGLKITEITSSKSSFILTGFLWVKPSKKPDVLRFSPQDIFFRL
ncbi:MAG: hypothetical protein GX905_08635 [Bacteroidales bacterium]|nr:hypothetical protein [Bacteroidales bacterium]